MGQAQFYNADFLQASATFSYIARHYAKDEEVVAEARLWQAVVIPRWVGSMNPRISWIR